MSHAALSVRWGELWRAVAGSPGDAVYRDLAARYAEPHRAYHSLDHIAGCLGHFDAARHLAAEPLAVELAIWFHDAIYDPRRDDNEARSAALAEAVLLPVGVNEDLSRRVADLIRLTTHGDDDLTGDDALLCDVDLAILGATPEQFNSYNAAIRQEYDWAPAEVFGAGRGWVLARFLARRRIYQTDFFASRLEAQARANLLRAVGRYQP